MDSADTVRCSLFKNLTMEFAEKVFPIFSMIYFTTRSKRSCRLVHFCIPILDNVVIWNSPVPKFLHRHFKNCRFAAPAYTCKNFHQRLVDKWCNCLNIVWSDDHLDIPFQDKVRIIYYLFYYIRKNKYTTITFSCQTQKNFFGKPGTDPSHRGIFITASPPPVLREFLRISLPLCC